VGNCFKKILDKDLLKVVKMGYILKEGVHGQKTSHELVVEQKARRGLPVNRP
jgi:hypothetical protein